MSLTQRQKATVVNSAIIDIKRSDVSGRSLSVKDHILEEITDKVVRNNDKEKPGFAIFVNPISLFETKNRVLTFQKSLMASFESHLSMKNPQEVMPQAYLDLPQDEAQKHYDTSVRKLVTLQFSGYDDSVTEYHADNLRQTYASLCYGPYINIRGGTPKFLDILRIQHDYGYDSLDDLKEFVLARKVIKTVDHPQDLMAEPSSKIADKIEGYEILLHGLHFSKLPVIIFNNKNLFHGATRATRKNGNMERVSRSLSYVGIRHVPQDGGYFQLS